MIRPALLAATMTAAFLLPAAARTQAAPPVSVAERLDRIETKLDAILRRLDADQPDKAPSPHQAPLVTAPPAATAAPQGYEPGAVAIVHAAPATARDLPAIPTDSVGGFLYTGGPVTLSDLHDKGVRYAGMAALELQGWLRVTAAGRTQLAAEVRSLGGVTIVPPACLVTAWLEDRPLGTQTGDLPVSPHGEKTLDLVLGADLEPGLYRVRLWTACTPTANLKIATELLIKEPADMNLRAVRPEDILHHGT